MTTVYRPLIVEVMEDPAPHLRVAALETDWSTVTALGIYTHHDVHAFLETEIIAAMGPAAVHGAHWYYGPPPRVGQPDAYRVRRASFEPGLPAEPGAGP